MARFHICCQNLLCKYVFEWDTQPSHNQMPWGNLILASAILYSGTSPSKALLHYKHCRIPMISPATYFTIQRLYLIPVIHNLWLKQQNDLLQEFQGKPLIIGGDGRCDSPGHSAKYCSYTLMEMNSNKVLDFSLVQVHVHYINMINKLTYYCKGNTE